RVEMVAADDDRRPQLAPRDHLVEAQAGLVPFTVPEPADAGRQPLERHALAGELDPSGERFVVAEQVQNRRVGGRDVGRVARQGGPAERALALTEQRPDIGRYEAGEGEGTLVAAQLRLTPDRVAVVEDLGAGVEETDHRLDVPSHGRAGALRVLLGGA